MVFLYFPVFANKKQTCLSPWKQVPGLKKIGVLYAL